MWLWRCLRKPQQSYDCCALRGLCVVGGSFAPGRVSLSWPPPFFFCSYHCLCPNVLPLTRTCPDPNVAQASSARRGLSCRCFGVRSAGQRCSWVAPLRTLTSLPSPRLALSPSSTSTTTALTKSPSVQMYVPFCMCVCVCVCACARACVYCVCVLCVIDRSGRQFLSPLPPLPPYL